MTFSAYTVFEVEAKHHILGIKKYIFKTPVDKIIQALNLSFPHLSNGDHNRGHKAFVYVVYIYNCVCAVNWHS